MIFTHIVTLYHGCKSNKTKCVHIQVLDESHQKYKFMEKNLMARRRKLKSQVPDINSSLAMLKKLKSKNEEGEEAETQFLLSDQVYAKATIPPTEKVSYGAKLSCCFLDT